MKIETAGNRAADLCRQMLTYAGKSQSVQSRVNLWLLIDEVAKMLKASISQLSWTSGLIFLKYKAILLRSSKLS
jgi:hypothetical protein